MTHPPAGVQAAAQAGPPDRSSAVLALLQDVPLTPDEAGYVEAARAANTLRGYRSDWREFTAWCSQLDADPLPAAPPTVTGYLSELPGTAPRSAP